MIRELHFSLLLNLPLRQSALEEKRKMQKIFTIADYKLKQGRFLILSTISEDRCTEVDADVVEGSNKADEIAGSLQDPGCRRTNGDSYTIHEGFIIANSN